VEPGIVESFLGRIEDPKKTSDTELNIIDDPAFRTIMVIELKQQEPVQNVPEQFQSSLKNLNEEITKLLATYGGKSVKQNNYYYLVSFQSVSNAVQVAFKIQSAFCDAANVNLKNKIPLKMGLSAGLPVTDKQML